MKPALTRSPATWTLILHDWPARTATSQTSGCALHFLTRRSITSFSLYRSIGSGAASAVFYAVCNKSALPVAIKVYLKSKLSKLNRRQVRAAACISWCSTLRGFIWSLACSACCVYYHDWMRVLYVHISCAHACALDIAHRPLSSDALLKLSRFVSTPIQSKQFPIVGQAP